jgi:hypothetical protein
MIRQTSKQAKLENGSARYLERVWVWDKTLPPLFLEKYQRRGGTPTVTLQATAVGLKRHVAGMEKDLLQNTERTIRDRHQRRPKQRMKPR